MYDFAENKVGSYTFGDKVRVNLFQGLEIDFCGDGFELKICLNSWQNPGGVPRIPAPSAFTFTSPAAKCYTNHTQI